MLVSQLPDNRSRSMSWMTEEVWQWHIVFTDHSADTQPRWDYLSPVFECMQTNFGNNLNEQSQQGPPSVTRLKYFKGSDSNTIEGA